MKTKDGAPPFHRNAARLAEREMADKVSIGESLLARRLTTREKAAMYFRGFSWFCGYALELLVIEAIQESEQPAK